ncbi:MAG: hypothetical protein ACREAK_03490 [Nitrosarchaeum sp.]
MSSKLVIFFMILVFIIVIPTVDAQEISIGEKAEQKSVQVVISSSNEIHVKHVIISSNSTKQIELIQGTITNLTVSDEEGKEKQFGIIGDNKGILIYPSQENTIVEYDLGDVLFLKDNVWSWNFTYLETTSFIIPKEIELIFVNSKPVYLGEKNGIMCHGCQMILEYSINEPKILKNIKFNDKEFLIEIRTFAEINQLNFDQLTKSISFEVNGKNQFITIIIPLELLPAPYNVFMESEKVFFHDYINNGTHVWLNIRPDNLGIVSIVSTTDISDEKPTIQDNPSISVSSLNQDIIVYILLGVIVLIGFVVTISIMRKKKSSSTSRKIPDDIT